MRNRTWTTVALLGALGGCDPYGGSIGVVVGPGDAPIEGAEVTLDCANVHRTMLAKTDAAGRWSLQAVAMDSPQCLVRIVKPGFETRTLPVTETCHVRGADRVPCGDKPPRIALVPVAPAGRP